MSVDRDTSHDDLLRLIDGDPKAAEPSGPPSLPLEVALARLPELLDLIVTDGHRVVLRREGQEPVALVPFGDFQWIQELEGRADREAVDAARAEGGPYIPLDEVKKDWGVD